MSHSGNTFNKRRSIDQIADDHKIDDRWTESKLIAAGYEWRGDKACRTCKEPVSFYKREQARDYKGPAHWLVLDQGALSVHQCGAGR